MRTLPLLVLIVASVVPVAAQPDVTATEVQASQAAYYSFLRTGEVPIEVFMLGAVRSTGVYAVGLGTTLDQLVALSGGVTVGGEGRLERDATVRLYHEVGGNRVLSYEQPLGNLLSGSPPLPSLEDGDVVVVDVRLRQNWFTLDNTLRLATTAISLFLLIERLVQ